MANRNLQQKMLKKKRFGRYKLRSGAPTEVIERVGPVPFTEDATGNTTTGKAVMVHVRTVRFSRQVINHAEDSKPRRQLWKEAKDYLENYHANLSAKRD